ncbi:MAG: hypothetical protein ACQBVK_04755, partial [Candidatus Phytoplasma sp. TWB_XP]
EQKDLSANEVKQLNEEINNLRNNIEQKQVNYQAHLLIKEEEIKQLQTIIKQKDEEINQLQQTIQEQAQEIQRLTIELDHQIELFAERGKKILQLEGTIKALEDANSGLSSTNKELQHQINKLKNELEQEKLAHKSPYKYFVKRNK